MGKLYNKKHRIIVGMLLLFLIIMNLFYWGSRKEGFFCDELYSYHFTSQVQHPYLVVEREGKTWLNNWHSSDFFQDYLTITKDEAFDIAGTWQAVKADVHPPFYYLLLELSSSIFSFIFPGVFTKWSGIFVNILFFMLTTFFLWKLARKLTKSDFWSAAVCILYGFSPGAVSMVVFIRMYTTFTCFAVLFTYLNVLLWKELWTNDKKVKNWLYPVLTLTTILGILNQYYFVIYAFFISIVIWGCSLLMRKYSFAVKYALAMGVGVVGGYLIWPNLWDDIFSGYRGKEAFGNLAESNGVLDGLTELFAIIDGELFGKGACLILFLCILIVSCRFLLLWWHVDTYKLEDGSIRILFERKKLEKKLEFHFTMQSAVFLQILMAVFFYITLISKIAPYREDRYIFPVFPMIVLLVVALVKKLITGITKDARPRIMAFIFLFICMLFGYFSPGVNYLYQGTENNLQTANLYSDLPAFYITSGSSYRACGESVYFSKAKCTYPMSKEEITRIPEALVTLDSGNVSRCLFYIDLYYEDRDAIAQEISQVFTKGEMRWLFNTEYSTVYIIE